MYPQNKTIKSKFFTWFDNATDIDQTFIRGTWDFYYHILRPIIIHFKEPEKKTSLEIGYGGGRILAAACNSFNKVIGIDIHENKDVVEDELRKRGYNNFELLISDGKNIPLENNSIDFVYSFIVFQHLEKIDILKNYLRQIYRVIKPGCFAILYYGRFQNFSRNKKSKFLLLLDKIIGKLVLRKGYNEIDARVNETNLILSKSYAKKISKQIGFKYVGTVISRRNVPDGINYYGGQYGLIIKK